MTKKLFFLLVVGLSSGLLALGCGDDDDEGTGGGGGGASTEQQDTGGGGGGGDEAAARSAQEGCEAGIENNAAIEESKQDELTKECEKVAEAAGSGDKERYRKAYGDFCTKLADALPAQARDAARSACRQSVDSIK